MAARHDHAHPGLDVKVERTGPCLASITLTVSGEEFARARKLGLQNIAQRTRMKGFRPGKVPLSMVEKQFGEEVERDVVQHFLNHAYDQAVKENELRPAAHPRVDADQITRAEDGGLSHELQILLRPDIELGEVKGLSVEAQPVDVDDEQLDAAIDDLRRQSSRLEPAGEDGLPEDGMAMARLDFLVPESEEPVVSREGIRLGPKASPRGVDPEVFEKAIVGATEGEERSFELTYPDDFPEEAVRGRKGTCRVQLSEVFRIQAPSDEELFGQFEATDEESFRGAVRVRLLTARREAEDGRVENALLDQLLEAHPMELPEPLIEGQADAKVAELRDTLEKQGLEGGELETKLEEERRNVLQSTERAMRAVYLMEEIARREELQVSEEDLGAEMEGIAERNQVALDEVRKYYQEEGLIQQLALELLERKVRNFLRESADIRMPSA